VCGQPTGGIGLGLSHRLTQWGLRQVRASDLRSGSLVYVVACVEEQIRLVGKAVRAVDDKDTRKGVFKIDRVTVLKLGVIYIRRQWNT